MSAADDTARSSLGMVGGHRFSQRHLHGGRGCSGERICQNPDIAKRFEPVEQLQDLRHIRLCHGPYRVARVVAKFLGALFVAERLRRRPNRIAGLDGDRSAISAMHGNGEPPFGFPSRGCPVIRSDRLKTSGRPRFATSAIPTRPRANAVATRKGCANCASTTWVGRRFDGPLWNWAAWFAGSAAMVTVAMSRPPPPRGPRAQRWPRRSPHAGGARMGKA